jgi:hypothetical protein
MGIDDRALNDLTKNTLLVVGALFPIVNPIGNTPFSFRSRVDFGARARELWQG